ncbi:hypothetical protein OS493_009710 [Desmophyllum pertusum]|uniref:Uncharacterized protein n=1 Tax=Desmophyllum pertusum TaxID=174260 RepID=A0A9W9YR53_9CNID|nr:hypothetical protein OS493_009710 [Desmophyllum pertusum]
MTFCWTTFGWVLFDVTNGIGEVYMEILDIATSPAQFSSQGLLKMRLIEVGQFSNKCQNQNQTLNLYLNLRSTKLGRSLNELVHGLASQSLAIKIDTCQNLPLLKNHGKG